ncbi:1-deoxy-D-xylulose-5-phosphate reductoisomerase [Alkalihalobacillus sp. CinArs1]|uniref:1-deoxy-D-xylulose-5-phosphate reductoisomerase n=1 Tax=Alkalihalobacillus sp. CinArs1 TaxID=2995314 RepID=UPI0022DE3718|nr:1-deoxy-D-xylulose-5-phosphate reductoisomerase [Alkalihalobacillus sp. CinArs1]
MKKISLLGASGSIGTQTLDIIRMHPELFSLVAVSVGRNIEKAAEIVDEFQPKLLSVQLREDAESLRRSISRQTKIVYGEEGLLEVACHPESTVLVNAVLGSIGLTPTLSAIEQGKTIAIANKETLVTAGHLVTEAAKKYGSALLPVDSEHSALFQCLNGEKIDQMDRLILTASGGSFRDKTRKELQGVSVEDALNHPNWSMGAKITIDSATMMNKGLEVIEAHWLFGTPYDQIDVLLHKESIIHSMVEYIDGSVMAHLGTPDMRIPIQYALSYPDRLEMRNAKKLNLWEVGKLHFEKVDFERFRSLKLAYDAGRIGGSMTAVLNAANETAVAAFLQSKIDFLTIEELVEKALEQHDSIQNASLEEILEIDSETRSRVQSLIK